MEDNNENLLEQLKYAFDEACDAGNIYQARKVMIEVHAISPEDALILKGELLDKPLFTFLVESDPRNLK